MNRFVRCVLAFLLLMASSAHAIEFNDGVRAHDALENQVRTLFEQKQFDKLDSMADMFRKKNSRFPDGTRKLDVFYYGFEMTPYVPALYFMPHINAAAEWRRIRPRSVTAQCVLAEAWMNYAWQARGNGYASGVKEDSRRLASERLAKAWGVLNEKLAPGVSDCPYRLNLRLTLAKAMGLDKHKFEAMFREAQRQDPGYYRNYLVKADYLRPRWYGEEGEWQQFITKVFDQNPRGEGATIYTRIAWSLYSGDEWNDFNRSGISWGKMKKGFKEINHNYPNSPWILNTFARFACRAGDLETMTALFKQIDSRHIYYPEAWGQDNVNACRSLGKR